VAHARLAVMATRGTARSGIYPDRLGRRFGPLHAIDESTQRLIDSSIGAVKGGELAHARARAQSAALRLISQGATVLVLACTELPVALQGLSLQAHVVDSTLALARMCVRRSGMASK